MKKSKQPLHSYIIECHFFSVKISIIDFKFSSNQLLTRPLLVLLNAKRIIMKVSKKTKTSTTIPINNIILEVWSNAKKKKKEK